MFLAFCVARSQTIKGVYLNGSDFAKGKIAFSCDQKKCKIKLREFPYRTKAKIHYGDSSFTLKKDSIFGYKDKSGSCFRFFNKRIYSILNQGESILLYSLTRSNGTPKDPQTFTTYYFSKNSESEIKALSLKNITDSFIEDKAFTYLLEIYFRTDNDLIEFDPIHKKYKLNRLFEISKNK